MASQSLADALENEVMSVCEILQGDGQVAPFLQNGSATRFKLDLKCFIEEGLTKAGSAMNFANAHSLTCGTTSRPWRFAQKDSDELIAMILQAFQQPLSLGDDVLETALAYLHQSLKESENGLQVFKRLRDSLDVQVREQEKTQRREEDRQVAATKAKARQGTPKSNGVQKVARDGGHSGDKDTRNPLSGGGTRVPKGPDMAEVITMASRLCPRLDFKTVQDVQNMLFTTDLREILRHAKAIGYEEFKPMDDESIKAIMFMWMLFINDQGSVADAEAIVCWELRKENPALALMLYGHETREEKAAKAEEDRLKGRNRDMDRDEGRDPEEERKQKLMDSYQSLTAIQYKGQAKDRCGISGLLQEFFGDWDYPQMIAEMLAGLPDRAKADLIRNLVKKAETATAEELAECGAVADAVGADSGTFVRLVEKMTQGQKLQSPPGKNGLPQATAAARGA